MARAPFQILVMPFRFRGNVVEFALFRRSDYSYWQGVAGGGEDGESAEVAAERETFEEAGVHNPARFYRLDSMAMIPVENVCGFKWGKSVLVIPEYSFCVDVRGQEVTISGEHSAVRWFSYKEALDQVKWDSNKSALWETMKRIEFGTICQVG